MAGAHRMIGGRSLVESPVHMHSSTPLSNADLSQSPQQSPTFPPNCPAVKQAYAHKPPLLDAPDEQHAQQLVDDERYHPAWQAAVLQIVAHAPQGHHCSRGGGGGVRGRMMNAAGCAKGFLVRSTLGLTACFKKGREHPSPPCSHLLAARRRRPAAGSPAPAAAAAHRRAAAGCP